VSPEITPYKGLDIKPLYSYFHADGLTSGTARHSVINRGFVGSGATNSAAANGGGAPAGDSTNQEERHTVASTCAGAWVPSASIRRSCTSGHQ